MSKNQILILVVLAFVMIGVAMFLGNWSEQINPGGITPHPAAEGKTTVEQSAPRDAYSFGLSMGLLACALGYCCLAFGLVISAKSKGLSVSKFTYAVAGLAATGFALSYLIDDYFY